ncbi:MAG: hypothetical protein ABI054_12000 [Planctomycetota bacterium]
MQPRRALPGFSRAALLCVMLAAGCGRASQRVGALELERELAGAVVVHVRVPDAAIAASARASIARHPPADREFKVTLQSESAGRIGMDPKIWIGTPQAIGAELALEHLGVSRAAEGFRFLSQDFTGRCDGVIATVADPERPSAVLEIVVCNDPAQALRWIRDWTPTARLGWQLIQAGAIRLEGSIGRTGEAVAQGAIDVHVLELDGERDARRGEAVDYDWIASPDFDPEREASWLAGLDQAASAVRERLNSITSLGSQWRLALRIHDRPEALARVCRVRGFAHLRPLEDHDELSLVHAPGGADNGAFEVARALALISAGEPRAAWLVDAVAAMSANTWFGRSRESWLAHLWTGDLVPKVESLVVEDDGWSALLAAPLRGALLQLCEETSGADFAARSWSAPPESIALPSDLEFREFLSRTIAADIEPARAARIERRAASLELTARRGACLVASPSVSDIFAGGFGSAGCETSLDQLSKLGSSAVAISWCSALEASEPRRFGEGPLIWTQADDAALYFTILSAQRSNLSVMLLPQLVASENGGWAGQVMLTTPQSRRALFSAWRGFVTHTGLLAELAGVDVLSIGSEAPDTAVTRESERNRRTSEDLASLRTDWTFLIGSGRSAFAGGLTYASRWDGEAQGIEFWKQLDFLGQNVFVPCNAAAAVTVVNPKDQVQQLAFAFAHLAGLAQQSGVRSLVTGIGISSTDEGWRQPSRPLGAKNLDVQVRFYNAVRRALQASRQQDLAPAGLFTWLWWTDPASGGPADRGFTPQHKPAEEALGRLLQSP